MITSHFRRNSDKNELLVHQNLVSIVDFYLQPINTYRPKNEMMDVNQC